VDTETGKVIFAPNLPGWKDVPLKKELEKILDVPVFLGNDCNVCTLGVFDQEFKAKPKHLVGIFIGTGIGGGLVVNGDLYCGHNLTAGEIGHMVIEVNGLMRLRQSRPPRPSPKPHRDATQNSISREGQPKDDSH
jgi:glucokinase